MIASLALGERGMDNSKIWSVDHVAASALSAALKLELSHEQAAVVAEHFARQRIEAYSWAAKRAHSHVIGQLEAASLDRFERKGMEWNEGFCAAEALVAAMVPDELLELDTSPIRSKGQQLRTMLRQAGTQEVGCHKT